MPHAKLDPARIRTEALRLFREGGLEGLTLRRLAEALGVGASSLYWHVPDKRALHAMLTEDIFRGCLAAMPETAGWAAWLRAFGVALWEAQHAMPDTRKLITLHPLTPETAVELRGAVVAALERRGLAMPWAMRAQHAVQALVTGWTTLGEGTVAGQGGQDGRAALLEALDALIEGWRGRVSGA